MTERYDVVIVGARCAGSPLAALLAGRGVSVALVERDQFPRDTLSSHFFGTDGLAFLDRLGVTDRLKVTGAPLIDRVDMRVGDLRWVRDWPRRAGDIGGMASIRRFVLDEILADAAAAAGAEVLFGAQATGLIEDGGRVAGLRLTSEGRERELRARLVVGADGRASTIARLCGARAYNTNENERFGYWAFFEDAQIGVPTAVVHRWSDRLVVACPTDGGLYEAACTPPLAELPRFRSDLEGAFRDYLAASEPVAETLNGAKRVGKIFGAVKWRCFFRDAAGPGWVLAGDAGHFKDPSIGRGMADAFRQADTLAPAIAGGLELHDRGLDRALARWGRDRDREFAPYYWLAQDMGKAGAPPVAGVELLRRLLERGRIDEFVDMVNHRARPIKVLGPRRAVPATVRAVAGSPGARGAVLREVAELAVEDARRRVRNRRPVYG